MSDERQPNPPRGPHQADQLTAWLREAADEIDNAHRVLDGCGIPRTNPASGNELTLAARIAYTIDLG